MVIKKNFKKELNHLAKDIHEKNPAEIEERLKELDGILSEDEKNIPALLEKSSCLRHLDRYDEAIIIHDILLAIKPKDIDYLFMKGLVLIESSQEEEAIKFFDKILKIDPKHRDAIFNKGLALRKLGKESEAKATMKEALK